MATKYTRRGFREHIEEHRPYIGTPTPGMLQTELTRRHVRRLMLVGMVLIILFVALGPKLGEALRGRRGTPSSRGEAVVFLKHQDTSDPTNVRYFLGVSLELQEGRAVSQIVATDKEGWDTVTEGSRVRVIYTVDEANHVDIREVYAEKRER